MYFQWGELFSLKNSKYTFLLHFGRFATIFWRIFGAREQKRKRKEKKSLNGRSIRSIYVRKILFWAQSESILWERRRQSDAGSNRRVPSDSGVYVLTERLRSEHNCQWGMSWNAVLDIQTRFFLLLFFSHWQKLTWVRVVCVCFHLDLCVNSFRCDANERERKKKRDTKQRRKIGLWSKTEHLVSTQFKCCYISGDAQVRLQIII